MFPYLNSLSLIILIISDAKASGSPMQTALRDGGAGTAISTSCERDSEATSRSFQSGVYGTAVPPFFCKEKNPAIKTHCFHGNY